MYSVSFLRCSRKKFSSSKDSSNSMLFTDVYVFQYAYANKFWFVLPWFQDFKRTIIERNRQCCHTVLPNLNQICYSRKLRNCVCKLAFCDVVLRCRLDYIMFLFLLLLFYDGFYVNILGFTLFALEFYSFCGTFTRYWVLWYFFFAFPADWRDYLMKD